MPLRSPIMNLIRSDVASATLVLRAIHEISKLFKMFDINEPYQVLIREVGALGLKASDLSRSGDFTLSIASYWSSGIKGRVSLIKAFSKAADAIEDNMSKFMKLFGCNTTNDFFEFLTQKHKAKEGILYFAKNYEVDPYGYEVVFDSIFNDKIMRVTFSHILPKSGNINFINFKEVYKEMLAEGLLRVEDGFVVVNNIAKDSKAES